MKYQITSRAEDFTDFLENGESLHDFGNHCDEKGMVRRNATSKMDGVRARSLDLPGIITMKVLF
jgi:hypothetical protein